MGLNFHGRVDRVIESPHEYIELVEIPQGFIDNFAERDPDWDKNPIYLVTPDSSPGLATFEEANSIVPGLTEIQYSMLTGHRQFLVLESDLLSEDFPPPFPPRSTEIEDNMKPYIVTEPTETIDIMDDEDEEDKEFDRLYPYNLECTVYGKNREVVRELLKEVIANLKNDIYKEVYIERTNGQVLFNMETPEIREEESE